MEHREEVSKLAQVQHQVDEVKGIMLQNIDKVCIHHCFRFVHAYPTTCAISGLNLLMAFRL
jgi:hypothetical protein